MPAEKPPRRGRRDRDSYSRGHLVDAIGNRAALRLLRSRRAGAGRPLDGALRADMQARLGHHFGDVRVHDDAVARASARAFGARAFTVGRDVFLGEGESSSKSGPRRDVLAHELAHVVDQRGQKPVVQCMKMGTGKIHLHAGTDAEVEYEEPPEDEKARVQGAIDRVKKIVDQPEAHSGCHSFFQDRSPSSETLRHAFDRAVVWKVSDVFAAGDISGGGAFAFPGEDNIAYNRTGYNKGEEELAEALIHELGHVAGIGLEGSLPHKAADEIRVACMAGASSFFRFRGGVDTEKKGLASLGFRLLIARIGQRGELRGGLDFELAGTHRAFNTDTPGEIGALSVGYGRRFWGGERWGGLNLYGELGLGGGRFRLKDVAPGSEEESVLGPGFILEIGARKEFFVRDVRPGFGARRTGAGLSIGYRAVIPLTDEAAEVMHGFYVGFDWSIR